MKQFIIKRFNVIVLLWMVALFTIYIIGHTWLEWYETSAKTIYYVSVSTSLLFLCCEQYYSFVNGWADKYQFGFNMVGLLTIAVNSIIFALNFQGIITNAAILLLILWLSVATITIGVLRNLKRYDHI